jgi:FixJ family two-component response regulator
MTLAATPEPVFIVDDDPAARESVAALVRSRGCTAFTYESAEDFLCRFDRSQNGCLVIDVRMPGMSGVDLQEKLSACGIALPVILLTGYGDIPTAVRAMRNGAAMFLEKPCDERQLWEAISKAAARDEASREHHVQQAAIRQRLTILTADEMDVLHKLVDGLPNKVIAKELDLGLRTVELRRATILQKMQASSLAELVRMVLLANGE